MSSSHSNASRRTVVIIPARGGSKGIPRKNLQHIGGLSLIARAVRTALPARNVDAVFVTTDDSEIADEALHWGAEVIHRPADLASDSATSEDALLHALEAIPSRAPFSHLVFMQCTSPFTRSSDLDAAIDRLTDFDVVFTVTQSHHFRWRLAAGGIALPIDHDIRRRAPRQELTPEYIETGSLYAMSVAGFLEHHSRFHGAIGMLEIPASRALEIDTQEDLDFARIIWAETRQAEIPRPRLTAVKALVMDFDGVLTDNRVLVSEDGRESVLANRSDGLAVELLRAAGYKFLVISKEKNQVVRSRCQKLDMDYRHGIDEKLPLLRNWCVEQDLAQDQVAYVGNDTNDLECLRWAGLGIAPADGHPTVLQTADWILRSRGGEGTVREIADNLLDLSGGHSENFSATEVEAQ